MWDAVDRTFTVEDIGSVRINTSVVDRVNKPTAAPVPTNPSPKSQKNNCFLAKACVALLVATFFLSCFVPRGPVDHVYLNPKAEAKTKTHSSEPIRKPVENPAPAESKPVVQPEKKPEIVEPPTKIIEIHITPPLINHSAFDTVG